MCEFLINNIFVIYGRRIMQLTCGIPVGINCAPLLAVPLFLRGRLQKTKRDY